MIRSTERIPLFEGLDPEAQQVLERIFEPFRCDAGTVIFEQGDLAVFLYLIQKGSVTIRYKPYDSPPITLTHIAAGGAFGWSAVVGNSAYTSAAQAREDLEGIRVRGADLRELATRNPHVGRQVLDKLAGLVSNRWKDANHQVRAIFEQVMNTENVPSRKGKDNMSNQKEQTRQDQIRKLIEQVSAYVEQFHGGTVEFVSLNGNRLEVRLGGACLGCPLLPATLHGWVAGTVHQFFPELEVVSAE